MGGFDERPPSADLLAADLSDATLSSLTTGAIDLQGQFSERWERTLKRCVQAIVSIRCVMP